MDEKELWDMMQARKKRLKAGSDMYSSSYNSETAQILRNCTKMVRKRTYIKRAPKEGSGEQDEKQNKPAKRAAVDREDLMESFTQLNDKLTVVPPKEGVPRFLWESHLRQLKFIQAKLLARVCRDVWKLKEREKKALLHQKVMGDKKLNYLIDQVNQYASKMSFGVDLRADRSDASLGGDASRDMTFHGKLKDYQEKGVEWLCSLHRRGVNGILADEMGLGKTVQVLAALLKCAVEDYDYGPFLVVAPLSTLHNWKDECEKFTPGLRCIPYWGSPDERKILRGFFTYEEKLKKKQGRKTAAAHSEFHIVITSYDMVLRDAAHLKTVPWRIMILDEAQSIKNNKSKRWNTLLSYKCPSRWLLSGTPIQNNMTELWSLLHFIMPGLFSSDQDFSNWFSKHIESSFSGPLPLHHIQRLQDVLKPFILRRVKKDVVNELPSKTIVLVPCELTTIQRALYREIQEGLRSVDLKGQKKEVTSKLQNIFMQLRKACCHPLLFDEDFMKFQVPGDVSQWNPFFFPTIRYEVPKALDAVSKKILKSHDEALRLDPLTSLPSNPNLWRLFNLWHPSNQRLSPSLSAMPLLSGLSSEEISWFATCANTAVAATAWPDRAKDEKETMLNDAKVCKNVPPVLDPLVKPKVVANAPTASCSSTSRSAFSLNSHGSPLVEQLYWDHHEDEQGAAAAHHLFGVPQPPHSLSFHPVDDVKVSQSSFTGRKGLLSLLYESGKMRVLDALLFRLRNENHKVLLYSQFTRALDVIELLLQIRNYGHIRLDGSSKIAGLSSLCFPFRSSHISRVDRRHMMQRFQNDSKGEIFVFLLSTRAGGVGINLTAADTVVFYDSDWNPTADSQAIDRCHRIGQKREVTVYRLVCTDTVEEKILRKASQKARVQDMIIQDGKMGLDGFIGDAAYDPDAVEEEVDDEQVAGGGLGEEELLDMLKG